jgi:hypothetical protein
MTRVVAHEIQIAANELVAAVERGDRPGKVGNLLVEIITRARAAICNSNQEATQEQDSLSGHCEGRWLLRGH